MDTEQPSRATWERERAEELRTKEVGQLASKVAELEFDLRSKRADIDALKSKLPPEGSVLLSKADAERWTAYSALGKPDELKAAIDARDSLTAEKGKRDRQDAIRAAAEASGYKPSVLERLAPDGLIFETRPSKDSEGKDVQAAYVKDAEGKETPLADYAAANFADFLPALTLTSKTPTVPTGPAYVRQTTVSAPTQPLTDAQFLAKKQAESDWTI